MSIILLNLQALSSFACILQCYFLLHWQLPVWNSLHSHRKTWHLNVPGVLHSAAHDWTVISQVAIRNWMKRKQSLYRQCSPAKGKDSVKSPWKEKPCTIGDVSWGTLSQNPAKSYNLVWTAPCGTLEAFFCIFLVFTWHIQTQIYNYLEAFAPT